MDETNNKTPAKPDNLDEQMGNSQNNGFDENSPRYITILIVMGVMVIIGLLGLVGFLVYQLMNIDEGKDLIVAKPVVVEKEDSTDDENNQNEETENPSDSEETTVEPKNLYTFEKWGVSFDASGRDVAERNEDITFGNLYTNNTTVKNTDFLTIKYLDSDYLDCSGESDPNPREFQIFRHENEENLSLEDHYWNTAEGLIDGRFDIVRSEYQENITYGSNDFLVVSITYFLLPLRTYLVENDGYIYEINSDSRGEDYNDKTCFQENLDKASKKIGDEIVESLVFAE